MNWASGFSAKYYMTMVDTVTWRDIDRIELTGGSIKKETSGLRESADVETIDYPHSGEKWVRIYLDVNQAGSNEHVALFTGLATSPSINFNGNHKENSIRCYSVLKPADDVLLPRGWYVPAGVNAGAMIKQLLDVTPAPVEVVGVTPSLTNSIIAEDGETKLSMTEKILTAIGWRLKIKGNGSITIEPEATDPIAILDPLEYDVIEMEVSVDRDWYECPNCFMAIDDDMTAIARDDSKNSLLSTVNRGREVWACETSCSLSDTETIEQYAIRQLKELQKIQVSAEYDRRYIPDVIPTDLIRLKYPAQNLDGVFQIESQTITLSNAARTSEKVMGKI